MRVKVFNYYMHLSQLVYVCGATGMTSPETPRFTITWKENGEEKRSEVRANELHPAPTLPELHDNYMLALNVISEQARRIEELEAQQITPSLMNVYKEYVAALEYADRHNTILYPSEEGRFQQDALNELCKAVDPKRWSIE